MTLYNTAGRPRTARSGSPITARRSRQGLTICGVIAAFALSFYLLNSGVATSQDTGGTPVASPAATPAPDAPRITIDFTELNDSGVTGTATLFASGNATIIELDLEGTGEDHPAHIHQGTCDDIQPEPEYNLQNVGEEGASTTQVDVPLNELIDGDYVIDLHLAANQLGTLIVCGDIVGQPTNAAGTPVAIGGQGDPTAVPATATATASATSEPVTPEPTAPQAPTAAPTASLEPAATVAPTTEPTATSAPSPVATTAPASPTDDADAIGGLISDIAAIDGDGTQGGSSALDSGKGAALAAPSGTGGGTSAGASGTGDGTAGGSVTQSGKGGAIAATASTTSSLAATGSGSSLVFPATPYGAAVTASGVFSVILFAAAMLLRRGQTRCAASRWRRLGL